MTVLIRDIEQGTRAWHELRLGIPTASCFDKIITPKTLKLSSQREGYMAQLAADWAIGEPEEEPPWMSDAMERGKALEPEARRYYEFTTDCTVEQVSFIYKDDARMVGCSPDGLVGDDGLTELKCPMRRQHLVWFFALTIGKERPKDYIIQRQAQLWVSGRKWVDFMSYYPGLPPVLDRTDADPKIQAAFDEHMPVFIEELLAGRQALLDAGVVPPEVESAPQGEKNGPYGDPSADLPDNVTILSAG